MAPQRKTFDVIQIPSALIAWNCCRRFQCYVRFLTELDGITKKTGYHMSTMSCIDWDDRVILKQNLHVLCNKQLNTKTNNKFNV